MVKRIKLRFFGWSSEPMIQYKPNDPNLRQVDIQFNILRANIPESKEPLLDFTNIPNASIHVLCVFDVNYRFHVPVRFFAIERLIVFYFLNRHVLNAGSMEDREIEAA